MDGFVSFLCASTFKDLYKWLENISINSILDGQYLYTV